MRTILRYFVEAHGDQRSNGVINMPVGARILRVTPEVDGERVAVLAMVNPKMPAVPHPVQMLAEGSAFGEEPGLIIGSIDTPYGALFVFRSEPWPKPLSIVPGATTR